MRKATRTAETVVRSNFGSAAAGSRLQARSVDVFRTDRQNNDGGTYVRMHLAVVEAEERTRKMLRVTLEV